MTITNLDHLLAKFRPNEDHEGKVAYFRTKVPWVAPEAYLNTIFKPLPKPQIEEAERRLRLPDSMVTFFQVCNGAILFSDALSVWGILPPGTLLNRTDRWLRSPYSIEAENRSWRPIDTDRFLGVGGYSWDGSTVCIDRADGRMYLFKRGNTSLLGKSVMEWENLENWLTTEIKRLSFLFDETGRCLVDGAVTIPRPVVRF